MKRNKLWLIILSILLSISLLYFYDYHKFHEVKKLINVNEMDKIASTSVNKNGETIVIKANATLITVNDKDYIVDNDKLFALLSKYDCVRSRNKFFPYPSESIKAEISLIQNHRPRHIILGEFNIWYESSDTKVYNIINGNTLPEEVITLVSKL